MAQEIVITSVPRGVRPGRTGFQIAMRTAGMRDDVCSQLESLGVYRHMPPGGGPNPTCYFHKIVQTGAGAFSVLGRIVDAGADYSSRSNKLTHLIVIPQSEVATLTATSPAASLLAIESRLVSQWAGAPEERSHPFSLSGMPPSGPRVCVEWQRLTGDAGWGGVVAERAMAQKPVLLVAPDSSPEWCQRILRLFDEASSLIPPTRRWSISFDTTVFTSAGVTLRGTYAGSPESNARQPGLLVIDLANPVAIPGEYLGSAHVATARSGVAPQTRYKQPSQPPQQATTPQPSSSPLLTDEFGFPVEPGRATPPQLPRSPAAESDLDTDTAAKKAKRPRTTRSGGSRDGGNHVYPGTNHWQAYAVMAVLVVLLLASVLTGYYLIKIKPSLDKKAAEQAEAEQAAADKAAADKAVADKAAADKAAADKAAADKPEADKPEADKPEADKPEADKPEADKPEADKAVTDKAVTDKAVTDKAVTDKAAAEKPAAEKPALTPVLRSTEDIKARAAAGNCLDQMLRQVKLIDWPTRGDRTVLAKDLISPAHLNVSVYLPQPKHDLDWLPTVAVPDEKKLEWTFKGVPGDPTKQWGRVVVAEDKADTGILAFERADDCPEICAFVPFAIVIDSQNRELTFSQLPREYSFPNASSTLDALKKSAQNESTKQFLLSDMPGVVLQSCVTGGTATSCSVAGRLPQNEPDRLTLRWQPVTSSKAAKAPKKQPPPPTSRPPYWSQYVLWNDVTNHLQLSSVPGKEGKGGGPPDWYKTYESNKVFDTDTFVTVALQALQDKVVPKQDRDKLLAAVSLSATELASLRTIINNWETGEKKGLEAALLKIKQSSSASFAPVSIEIRKSSANDQAAKDELIVIQAQSRLLGDWGSLVLKYASNGCNRMGWDKFSGSQSASLIIQENAAKIAGFLKPDADSKDRNLALALYIVANLESFLRERSVVFRQASGDPDSNYLSTPQIEFFGPTGEVVLEWEFRHRTPFDERQVTILKVVPGSTTP